MDILMVSLHHAEYLKSLYSAPMLVVGLVFFCIVGCLFAMVGNYLFDNDKNAVGFIWGSIFMVFGIGLVVISLLNMTGFPTRSMQNVITARKIQHIKRVYPKITKHSHTEYSDSVVQDARKRHALNEYIRLTHDFRGRNFHTHKPYWYNRI